MNVPRSGLACVALLAGAAFCSAASAAPAGADWPSAGHDLKNSRHQTAEKAISPKTVGTLVMKWAFTTDGDVTANPAVEGDFLYFPDSTGSLYKVNKLTGALVWKSAVAGITGVPGDFARATPAISGNALILGNQAGRLLGPDFGQAAPAPARVFAVDKNTGAALWSTVIDSTAAFPTSRTRRWWSMARPTWAPPRTRNCCRPSCRPPSGSGSSAAA